MQINTSKLTIVNCIIQALTSRVVSENATTAGYIRTERYFAWKLVYQELCIKNDPEM